MEKKQEGNGASSTSMVIIVNDSIVKTNDDALSVVS